MDFTHFNPLSQKEEDFLANFVARSDVFEYFLRQLHLLEPTRPANHHLIVAQRGYGKTSLLRRLAIAVRTEQEISSRLIALSFREEQHNVISLDVFWRNCLQSLLEVREDEKASEQEIELLDAAWEKHPPRQSLKREHQDGEPAKQEFSTHCERLDRRPLLLIDNLDALLAGLSENHQWSLRNDLQSEDGPMLIAAASRYPKSTHDQSSAFYDFFKIHTLDKLDDNEVMECLLIRAKNRKKHGKKVLNLIEKNPGRIAALNTLAGGNPRTLGVLYSVLESNASADVLSQLSAMLDTFTGWYQARTEELPIQSRAVFDALALNWDPMTAAAVGEATGLETTVASSQLSRLEKSGYVESVSLSMPKKGRNGYQVCERFFNIWYLMRNGPRRVRKSIKFLAVFLQSCFSTRERQSIARTILSDAKADPSYALALASSLNNDSMKAQLLEHANSQSFRLGTAKEYKSVIDDLRKTNTVERITSSQEQTTSDTESTNNPDYHVTQPNERSDLASLEQEAMTLATEAATFVALGNFEDAISAYDIIIERFGDAKQTALLEQVAKAFVNKGVTFGSLGKPENEIASYDKVIECFGDAKQTALLEHVARALINKGVTFGDLGKLENELVAYDEVIEYFGDARQSTLLRQVARALVYKGLTLRDLGNYEDAIATYDNVIERFGDTKEVALLEQVAKALVNKGSTLTILDKSDDAIAIYDNVMERFDDSKETTLLEQVAKAFVNKGSALIALGKFEDAITVCDKVIELFWAAKETVLLEGVARALVNKGVSLRALNKSEEAIATYDSTIERFNNVTESALLKQVAKALFNKGVTLNDLGNSKRAIAAYDSVIERFGDSKELALLEHVAKSLYNKGVALSDVGKSEDELTAYDNLIERFSDTEEPALLDPVAKAIVSKAVTLRALGNSNDAIAAFDSVIERFADATEPTLLEQVTIALVNKGFTLNDLGNSEDEIAVYDDVIERFGATEEPVMLEGVAIALFNKGFTLSNLGNSEGAIASYNNLIERFGDSNEPVLLERVVMSMAKKGDLLSDLGNLEDAIATYDNLIERFGNTVEQVLGEHIPIVLNSLGNLLLEEAGDPIRAEKAFEQGLSKTCSSTISAILHSNYAYTLALHSDNLPEALIHVTNALTNEKDISTSGQDLLKALTALAESPETRWQSVFEHILAAVEREDELLWSGYLDDLQRLLWYVLVQGQDDALRQLMEERQYPIKYAPLYHAFMTAIEGSDHLLKINPETRQAATLIYKGLARRLELYPKSS